MSETLVPPEVVEPVSELVPALGAANVRLCAEFGTVVHPDQIDRMLAARYAELARHARITQYLPVLAERSVRAGLRALVLAGDA